MPNYVVEYDSWNEYEYHVGESFFSLLILPHESERQRLVQFRFYNSIKEPYYVSKNHYGFNQITFRTLIPFTELSLHLRCNVHVKKHNPFEFSPLTYRDDMRILSDIEFQIENGIFLQPTPLTMISPEDIESGDWLMFDKEGVFEYLKRLNKKIHETFNYTPNVTDVHNTAAETFTLKKGVCQDYAHIFIGLSRLNHIPCRYVAGYLSQGKNFTGDLQMHAWVEAFVPGCGWIGFDPTNNLLEDYHYIKVCHGTDYNECGPIKGIIKGLGNQKTNYSVKVNQQ